jgi:hypothetical protein
MYQVEFELREGEANYGKIKVSNITAIPAGDERAFIEITGPAGAVKDVDFSAQDIDLNAGDNELLLDVPVDAVGEWLEGTYKVSVWQDTMSNPGNYTLFQYEFTFCPVAANAAISFVANCICAKITVEDESNYGSASVSRTMKIIPPTIPGEAAPATIEVSASSHTFDFSWANVKYQVILEATVTTEIIPSVFIYEENSTTGWYDVVCDYDLCGLISCVTTELNRILNLAQSKGGLQNLPTYEFDAYIKTLRNFLLHNAYIDCGDYAAAQAMYETIKGDLNCQCGCSPAGTTEPVAVTAACADGASEFSFNPIYPIEMNLSGGVWTVNLNATWLAKVNALTRHTISSPNLSIDVSSAYSAVTNLTNWNVDVRVNTWNEVEVADLTDDFDDWTLNKLAYRKTVPNHVELYAKLRSDVTFATDGTEYTIYQLPVGFRPTNENTVRYWVMTEGGQVAGFVYVDTSGWIRFRPYFNVGASEEFLHIALNFPIDLDIEDLAGGAWIP